MVRRRSTWSLPTFNNRIRAGYSIDVTDLINGIPRDAADDNYNSFDPYPPFTADNRVGEVGDLDFLDPAGAFLLPVERLRRYVTPGDINGTGRIVQWDGVNHKSRPQCRRRPVGTGRVLQLFPAARPAGTGHANPAGEQWPLHYPGHVPLDEYRSLSDHHGHERGLNPRSNTPEQQQPAARLRGPAVPEPELPGTEHPAGFSTPARRRRADRPASRMPTPTPAPTCRAHFPTYDASVNGNVNSDGLNEADEMNLYVPNAQLDTPFGYGDLEWLYRQQDVDGGSLVSRLAQLAPVSFYQSSRRPAPAPALRAR